MIQSIPTSMQTLWHRQELLSNNLANASTAGFKQDDVIVMEGADLPASLSYTSSRTSAVGGHAMVNWTDHSPAALRETERDLDVAIDGSGFFVVDTPRGPRYTRAGALSMDRGGNLVTGPGYRIQGENGPIAVRSAKVVIGTQGEVRDNGAEVGRLRVVDFPKPYRLVKEGDGLFAPGDPSTVPVPATDFQARGGMLEQSNVNPVKTMVQMIEMLRHYESAQRVVQSADEADRTAANDMGRV